MTMKLRRASTIAGGFVLALCMSKGLLAMVNHQGWIGWMNYGSGDVISCQGGMDYADDSRSVVVTLWGPNNEGLGYSALGEGPHYVYAETNSPSIGPGTYRCHVDFTEIDFNNNEEDDSGDWYFVVS